MTNADALLQAKWLEHTENLARVFGERFPPTLMEKGSFLHAMWCVAFQEGVSVLARAVQAGDSVAEAEKDLNRALGKCAIEAIVRSYGKSD